MSYILDALKKAEAERLQGTATEARPAFSIGQPQYDERQSRRRRRFRRAALLILLALVLLALALLAPHWRAPLQSAPTPPVARPTPHLQPTPTQAPAAAPGTRPATAVPAGTPDAPPETPERPVLRHSRPQPQPKPTAARPDNPQASMKAAPVPTITLHELPPAIRQQIPSLATSGFLYSGNPRDRSVLLNNRLLHEGDQVAPGLILEQLLPNGMVLNYEGHRFRTGY